MMISIRKLKKKKDKSSKDKAVSKRVTKKKNKSVKSEKSTKSSRRRKKSLDKKKKSKASTNDTEIKTEYKEEPSKEVFDTSTFTFKFDQSFEPGSDNQTNSQKKAFETFTKTIVSLGVEGLLKEYETNILGYVPNGFFARTVFDQNTPLNKNRYKDVVCNDMTRVLLKDGRPGDYIHANYVRGLTPTFILTQGPVKESICDFWRMIIQEKVQLIVMLCDHVENGKKKCVPYFCLQPGKMDVADFVITTESVDQMDTHTIATTVVIQDRFTQKSLRITHYKIITWPDKTVAKSNLALLRTLRFVRSQHDPVVIHCSAGIGRTGTFTAVEIGIQCLLNGRSITVSDIIRYLRHCRMNSVQMDTQFLMLAEVIIDCGKSFKYVDDANLLEMITKLKTDIAKYVKDHPPPLEKKDNTDENEKDQAKVAPKTLAPPVQTPPIVTTPQQTQPLQQVHLTQPIQPVQQQVHQAQMVQQQVQQQVHQTQIVNVTQQPTQVHVPQQPIQPPIVPQQQVVQPLQQTRVPQPGQSHLPQQINVTQQVHIPQQIHHPQQVHPIQTTHNSIPPPAHTPPAQTPQQLQQLQQQLHTIQQQQQMAAIQQKHLENQMLVMQQQQQLKQQQQQQQQHVVTMPVKSVVPTQPTHPTYPPISTPTTPPRATTPPQK